MAGNSPTIPGMTIFCSHWSCYWLQRKQRDKLGFCMYERVILPAPALSETERSLHTRSGLSDLSFLLLLFPLPWLLIFLSNFSLSFSQFHFRCLILPNTFSLTSQSVAMEIRLCNFTDGLGRRQKIDWVGNEPSFAKRPRLWSWLYCYPAWGKQSPDSGFATTCLGSGSGPAGMWQHQERGITGSPVLEEGVQSVPLPTTGGSRLGG